MGAFSAAAVVAVQFSEQSPLQSQRRALSITKRRNNAAIRSSRTRICFTQPPFFFSLKSTESRVDGLHNLRRVLPSATIVAQKEETVVPEAMASTVEKEAVKNVLNLFLRKQGLTNAAATRTIGKSDFFINHLVSRLHTNGSELPIPALEIRDAVAPYLESLLEEHGDSLVDVVENFPNSPEKKEPIFKASPTNLPLDGFSNQPISKGMNKSVCDLEFEYPRWPWPPHSKKNLPLGFKKLEVMGPVTEMCLSGNLPSHTLYLLDIGMDLDQIKEACCRYPSFANYSLEEKIKPAVEFLLDLGMPQADIPSFLCIAPYCCGSNLSDNIIPTLLYLENLGMDKGQLVKILKRCPRLLKCKRLKVKRTVDFLHEIGVSTKNITKIITRYPQIINHSVDNRLRPVSEYFDGMGANVPRLFYLFPRVLCANLERQIKPVAEFLLGQGYSMEEIGTMTMKFGDFFLYNVNKNLISKWDFFLTMEYYPRSELVNFPRYFGYSLERRIKPRYEHMMKSDVRLELSHMLVSTDTCFELLLKSS